MVNLWGVKETVLGVQNVVVGAAHCAAALLTFEEARTAVEVQNVVVEAQNVAARQIAADWSGVVKNDPSWSGSLLLPLLVRPFGQKQEHRAG